VKHRADHHIERWLTQQALMKGLLKRKNEWQQSSGYGMKTLKKVAIQSRSQTVHCIPFRSVQSTDHTIHFDWLLVSKMIDYLEN
jgi:hypothetical protein